MADKPLVQFERIVVRVSGSLVAKIDSARGRDSVSQFVRDAIAEKLFKMKILTTESEIQAPDRKGKGGPKPKNQLGQTALR